MAGPNTKPPVSKSLTILGVHSNVAGDDNDYTSGHAWLTIHEGGKTETYGLWLDNENVWDVMGVRGGGKLGGRKSDVQTNLDVGYTPAASRYYKLSEAQAKQFRALLQSNQKWRLTQTCASWARDIVQAVVGEDLDADDFAGFETPRELGNSIQALEKKDPTSLQAPKGVSKNPASTTLTKPAVKRTKGK